MKLEELLSELKMSKAQLAKAIKVQPGTIYRWKCDSDVPVVVIRFLECEKILKSRGKK